MFTKEARKAFEWRRLKIIFYRPMMITLCTVGFWRLVIVRFFSHWLSQLDMEATIGIAAVAAVSHTVIVAWALNNAIAGREKMYESLAERLYVMFVKFREQRIFWPLHPLLMLTSILMLMGVMLTKYQSLVTGYYAVACLTMIVAVFWEVAMVADDPLNSRWYDDDDHISTHDREMTMDEANAIMAREAAIKQLFAESALHRRLYYEPEDLRLMDAFRRRHKDFKS